MNRRGFFTRIGSLIAGAYAATKAVPMFKSKMWYVAPQPPQRLWFSRTLDPSKITLTHGNSIYQFDNLGDAFHVADIGDRITIPSRNAI